MIRLWKRSHCSAIAAFSIATTVATLSAQTPAPLSDQSIQDATLTTLSGCIAADDSQKIFTLEEEKQHARYTLKNMSLHNYLNKRVEVTGFRVKGVKVQGGLYPNAYVAGSINTGGQAGGADPTQAAMVAQTGQYRDRPRPVIDFNVKSVKTLGACPPVQ